MLAPVARLESVRPGATLEGNLSAQPFPQLMVEVLRGNLGGRLEVAIHPEPRNHVLFRGGVPVRVDLPDLGPSLISLLVEEGVLGEVQGFELVRIADATATSESRLIEARGLVEGVALREARLRRAHAQLVRMFNVDEADFVFREGAEPVDPSEITLLKPLPLLFRGLLAVRDERKVTRHLPPAEVFRLAPNYPIGLDPFGFGSELERHVSADASVYGLMARGHAARTAQAAVASLHLAEMLQPFPEEESALPNGLDAPADAPSTGGVSEASEGLVVHRRKAGRPPLALRSEPPPSEPAPEPAPSESRPDDRRSIEQRLQPLEKKTYFQLLRVRPDTDSAQLERAYRFFLRRLQDEPDGPGKLAVAGLLREAFNHLRDPERRIRYGSLREPERRALEAEAKVERSVRVLGEGRDEEALCLISWASRLAPFRAELGALSAAFEWLTAPIQRRGPSPRHALHAEAERTKDPQLKLVLAAVLAQEGDFRGAKAMMVEVGTADHPIIERFVARGDR